jgi:SAM-dependent methyltransferase
LLEVGCGNGRDAVFFAGRGHRVTAIDMSAAAIERCAREHERSGVEFLCGTLPGLEAGLAADFDAVYSRFCLHAMTDEEELEMLAASQRLLRPGGALFLECRSINDPLARRGEVISPNERIDGHYRRFVIPDELQRRLRATGFEVSEFGESSGWARFGADDPVVIRAVAMRA